VQPLPIRPCRLCLASVDLKPEMQPADVACANSDVEHERMHEGAQVWSGLSQSAHWLLPVSPEWSHGYLVV
jgi:NAD(P)H-dependent FMN reductase